VVAPVIDQEALNASRERLDALMGAPVGNESQASFILQVGAFKNRENAKALQTKLEALDIGRVYLRSEESLTRVYVGPLLDRSRAEAASGAIQTKLSLKAQIKQYDVREHGQS
jgi:cell division septation protein DedD